MLRLVYVYSVQYSPLPPQPSLHSVLRRQSCAIVFVEALSAEIGDFEVPPLCVVRLSTR